MFIELTRAGREDDDKLAINTDHVRAFWPWRDGTCIEFMSQAEPGVSDQIEVREPFSWVLVLCNRQVEAVPDLSRAARDHAAVFEHERHNGDE